MSEIVRDVPETTPLARAVPSVSVAESSHLPETLVDVFVSVVRNHNRSNTLNYKAAGSWVAISASEMLTRMRHIAAGLNSVGVRHGDRVALLSESRHEWTLTDGGCIFAGAIDVPIYPTLTPPQVRYILQDSGASVLVLADRAKFLELKDILAECPDVKHLVFFDAEGLPPGEGLTLAQLEQDGARLEANEPGIGAQLVSKIKPDELATIIYTSGTTGEPKGVMLTHANLVSNLLDSSGHLSFGEQDTALSVLPLSHVFERQAMYMYLYRGMAVYFAESIEMIGSNLKEVQPTIFVGVPRIFEKIYARIEDRAAEKGKLGVAFLKWSVSVARKYAKCIVAHRAVPVTLRAQHKLASRLMFSKWRAAFGGRIRLLISGGAALPEDLGYVYLGAGIPIVQGYGLTETAPVITAANLEDNRIGTVGKPIPNVQVRIAADGEIETRGPNVMRGYFNKPEETKAVFTEDGWFKTGDIGTIDAAGYLRITDRKKELLKTSGGKYIAPQPIEQAIKGSRFVNQVVLLGDGRKFPAALIVPDWEQVEAYTRLKGIDVSDHRELCRHPRIVDLFTRQIDRLTQNFARYEKVKAIALLPNELTIEGGELTPTLKVKRRVIDQKYRSVIDELYEAAEKTHQA
ncbi:MAG TPA: long-chain fatty acid--CoA ligase [Pyrinomonadaceae bacterium]|nr:long-chain fatty acid--CoA ligase [Pyrinomonadaceae bacterium]